VGCFQARKDDRYRRMLKVEKPCTFAKQNRNGAMKQASKVRVGGIDVVAHTTHKGATEPSDYVVQTADNKREMAKPLVVWLSHLPILKVIPNSISP
jgi:hypothetical protein